MQQCYTDQTDLTSLTPWGDQILFTDLQTHALPSPSLRRKPNPLGRKRLQRQGKGKQNKQANIQSIAEQIQGKGGKNEIGNQNRISQLRQECMRIQLLKQRWNGPVMSQKVEDIFNKLSTHQFGAIQTKYGGQEQLQSRKIMRKISVCSGVRTIASGRLRYGQEKESRPLSSRVRYEGRGQTLAINQIKSRKVENILRYLWRH